MDSCNYCKSKINIIGIILFIISINNAIASLEPVDTVSINGSFEHSVMVDFPQRSYVITWISPEEKLDKLIIQTSESSDEQQSRLAEVYDSCKGSTIDTCNISLAFVTYSHLQPRPQSEDLNGYIWTNWDYPNKEFKPEKAIIAGRDGLMLYQEALKSWAAKLFVDEYTEMTISSENSPHWNKESFAEMLRSMRIEAKFERSSKQDQSIGSKYIDAKTRSLTTAVSDDNSKDAAEKIAIMNVLTNANIRVLYLGVGDGRLKGGNKVLVLSYSSTATDTKGVLDETSKILGAYLGAIKSGWDCEVLSVIVGDKTGKITLATWICAKEWIDAYVRGDLTSEEIMMKALGSTSLWI